MKSLENIFEQLGLSRNNGLFITRENLWQKTTDFPNRVKRVLENKIKPDAFFCFDNKPLILFFLNPKDKGGLHKSIWNFNECPIVFIIEYDVIEIFNGFKFLEENNALERLGGAEKLTDFNYFELVTGKTWDQYSSDLAYENRIDYHLLNNIKSARRVLVNQNSLAPKIANALIGKAIFVRYLIDRKVKMKFDNRLRTWNNSEFCNLLSQPMQMQAFFQYLEDEKRGFNGELFPLSEEDYKQVKFGDIQVLQRLLGGEEISSGQSSLFDLYDFSIIPIEFISNVYELFIGQDNQKKEGAYYTPLFLVDYMLKETVEKKLSNVTQATCKVLDPACGSGIFLVETLRKIIEKYIDLSGIDAKSDRFKTAIKRLAQENIYGVDKDESAVQVAVFSIYLTLLDYLEPPGIETFQFPHLFNTNFFVSDFFDEEAPFNDSLKKVDFDFILGNPPWKGNGMDIVGNKYLNNRKKREGRATKKFIIAINNNEIAEGFVLRTSDFSNQQTIISLIIRSSCLYNLGYNDDFSPFRQYWLEEYYIDKVLELAPVRHEVFEKSNQPAIAPAVVLFYRYANGAKTDTNIVEHISIKQSRFFSLFKIFTINRNDYKQIEQKKLKQFDWIWKTLVYGSYLDFLFIKRIKDEFPSVKTIISDQNRFIEGTGIQYSSDPTYDSRHLLDMPFVDSYGVTPFFIVPEKISQFDKLKVHRLRDERLFRTPMLLIREGIDMDSFTAKCVIPTQDLIFKDSITSIKALTSSGLPVLRNIASIFSTSLFAYYAVNLFSSIGIERERVKNYNKYSLPYLEIDSDDRVVTIENYFKLIYTEKNWVLWNNIEIERLYNAVRNELSAIEKTIFETLKLNDLEQCLIDYAISVNKTMIIGDSQQKKHLFSLLAFKDKALLEYAYLFISRFKSKLNCNEKKFVVEIWHTNQIVGMFFKMVPTGEYVEEILWKNKQDNNSAIIALLIKLGSEKITERLFVQKDIRGFEIAQDCFYIFKPNERRLWHKAIGYLDVNEFADAILKAGRDGQ